jgi:hypothetical protein
MFTTAFHLSYPERVVSVALISLVILFSCLLQCLPIVSSAVPIKPLYAFPLFPMHTTFQAHHILLSFIVLIVTEDKNKIVALTSQALQANAH